MSIGDSADKDDLKTRQQEISRRVKPHNIAELIVELTEATLDHELKWEPLTSGGFITTIGSTTFKVDTETDTEPPFATFSLFSVLDDEGRESWREIGAGASNLYRVVKRKASGVDDAIQDALAELRKRYPK